MSRVRAPRDDWSRIMDLERRLASLERSNSAQSAGIAVNDTAGNRRLYIGPISAGVWGVQVFDANGVDLVTVDNAGLHVYNAAGIEEVRAGKLNTGPDIYGLGVLPYGGTHLQQVVGIMSAQGNDTTNVTSTTDTAIVNGSLSAEIGPSGQALITVAAEIATNGVSQEGYLNVYIDGVADVPAGLAVSASTAVNVTSSATTVKNGLTPGVHTFALKCHVSSGATCSFYTPVLTVQAL